MGYITKPELQELSESFPQAQVVIKWSGMPREQVPACQAIDRIQSIEDQDIDYCREVFFSAQQTNKLREVLGA